MPETLAADMDVTAGPTPSPQSRRRLGVVAVGTLAALGYAVFVGGTGRGELDSVLSLVSGAVAGLFIVLYLLRAPTQADRVDKGILLALLFFAGAAVLSMFPRQSFDAVLGALVATAGLFVLRGELARPEVRIWFIRLLAGLAITITFITAAQWFPQALRWWSLTGWSVIPPLDLNFSAAPWGHRHDLALLTALLYPSLWIGQRTPLRAAAVAIFGFLVLGIVILDGSRNLWLAILGATAAVVVPVAYRLIRERRQARRAVIVAALIVAAVILVSGLATAAADRLLNLQSLGWRSAMWGPLVQAWTEHPVAGYGPGSFSWILPQTDYFDTSTWAPRHPDSAFFQLLAEGGLLGLASAATVIATLSVPVFRGRSTAAKWALLTFVLASVGANPTDFPFLIAVAVAWTAYAVPRERTAAGEDRPARRAVRIALLGGLGVIALAFAATTIAGIFYSDARRSAEDRDLAHARQSLTLAIALDPGMALYPRQRGTLDYLSGDAVGSLPDLENATRLNPSDDLAWRTLALAYQAAGEDSLATAARDRAIDAQRSDPANLLLRAREQRDRGETEAALETLGEVIQTWPATVAAPGWASLLPTGVTTSQVIDEAIRRWEAGLPSLEPFAGQGLWLVALGDRPDLEQAAIQVSGTSESLARAALEVMRCDPQSRSALDALSDSDRRTQLYWQLRMRSAALDGETDPTAQTLLQIMKGYPILQATADDSLRPVIETGFNADIWGYRRQQILWRTNLDELPSPDAAEARWLFDPGQALGASGLADRLPGCH